ncbi:uracil phosphoribosyltransferase-domain-containing protein [Xylaria bambusicola]|uniref:uracil phosphoribosyltransferase-domain-containing protein n=1 Tax=Xylaria bambusicola TaxID=326684 RepID=UPI00200854CB|nr:uracil phosphoribosyltransferase-domain-containing protein [Xylaria bambusicola]KAI0502889.1 uracil phosphoribosyltransferase-domain-containing protein [Xylaria bambusicola]
MSLPANVHVSKHPCLLSKLSRLRSRETEAREVKSLVHEIALIVGCEALASTLTVVDGPKGLTPIGYEYTTTSTEPQEISVVPILRSGLGMVDAIQTLLPTPVPVHHLGLYREPSTLEPVEYYNNLPNHTASGRPGAHVSSLAVILDPVIATGGTCVAAIQTLKEWGVKKILVLSVIAASDGVRRAAEEWPEAVEIWVAGVDSELTPNGMLKPGLGDIGDRIFLTIGK